MSLSSDHHCRQRRVVMVVGRLPAGIPRDERYRFIEVDCAVTSLAIAQIERIDLIVVDATVPGAWIACRLLTARFAHAIPVIVLAAEPHESARRHALRAGASAVACAHSNEALMTALETASESSRSSGSIVTATPFLRDDRAATA